MDEANVQKTIVCTFIGHSEIYDWATFGDFLVNLEMLLDQHQEVEFLVYWRQKSFKELYDIISLVILSDEKYQDRKITITQVAEKGRQKMMSIHLPKNVDRVIAPTLPPPQGEAERVTRDMRLQRWCIENATHVMSYVYLPLCEKENQLYWYAKELGRPILDIACPDTKAEILADISRMSQRQQFILQKGMEGQSPEEIASQLNLSTQWLQCLLHKGKRKLVRNLKNRRFSFFDCLFSRLISM